MAGIDVTACVNEADEPCDCESAPVRGVFEAMDTPYGIQRCDACQRFDGDLSAAYALAQHVGGTVKALVDDTPQPGEETQEYGETLYPVRIYDGTPWPDGVLPAPEQGGNPWVELDGEPIDWTEWHKAKNTETGT